MSYSEWNAKISEHGNTTYKKQDAGTVKLSQILLNIFATASPEFQGQVATRRE